MYRFDVLDRRAESRLNGATWFENVRVSLELVSPADAEKYLATNKDNYRSIRHVHVKRLARDMSEGDWQFTNATIGFDVNGTLTDGQHRLAAVVESGVDCWMLVVRGMPEGSAGNPATDTGVRRSLATHLHKHGVASASTVAAAARLLLRLRGGANANPNNRSAASDVRVAKIVAANSSIEDAVRCTLGCRTVAMGSVAAAWFWLVRHEDEDLALDCIAVLEGQKECITSHPFAKLRDVLMQTRGNQKNSGKANADFQLRLFMSAWARAVAGDNVKVLRPLKVLKISDAADEALQRMVV